MSVTAFWYGKAAANILGGETAGESSFIDYLSDNIKVALCTVSYVPNQDTDEFFSDVTNEVIGSAGYTTGGALLGTKTIAYTAGSNTVSLGAANTVWSSSTITARIAVIYKDTTVASTSPLMGWVNFGADVSTTSGTFTIAWAGGVIFTLVAA